TLSTSSPRRAKSAERMDGAMTAGCMANGSDYRKFLSIGGRPRRLSAPAAGLDLVIGSVDLARPLLRLRAQFRRRARQPVRVVLRHQPAIGLVDLRVGGVVGHSQYVVRRGLAREQPVRVKGMADQQPDQAPERMPQQQPAGDEAEQFSVPAFHGLSVGPARPRGPGADSRARMALHWPARWPPALQVPTTLTSAELPGLPLFHRGKVRDVFALGRQPPPAADDAPDPGECLLIVATDRLSAFDVVLPDPIPGKGEMLCQIS